MPTTPVQRDPNLNAAAPQPAPAASPDASLSAPKTRKSPLRIALLALVLVGAAAVVYLSPLRGWLQDFHKVKDSLDPLGFWKYPICIVGVACLVAAGAPRLLFCALAGMIFGFWTGLLLTHLGTMLGYYALFLFVRWGGRDLVLHRRPMLRKWADLIHDQGIMGIILLRQLPIHGMVVNLGLGLSRLKHRQFLIGTAIGICPESIPATLTGVAIGAGIKDASFKHSALYIALAVIAFAILWIASTYLVRRMRRTRQGSMMIAEVSSGNPESSD